MVRRVFFSFHYERDNWRVNPVRNAWVTRGQEAAGFEDAVEWEEVQKQSEEAIYEWIDDQLHGTSVTVILIGNETAGRKYIEYEIKESLRRGNGIVGVKIHRVKDKENGRDFEGSNPLKDFVVETGDGVKRLSEVFETYDWKRDDGRDNMGDWVEEAKQNVDGLSKAERNSVRKITTGEKSVRLLQAAGKVGGVIGAVYLFSKALEKAGNDSGHGQNRSKMSNHKSPDFGSLDPESLGSEIADSGIDLFDLDDGENDELR